MTQTSHYILLDAARMDAETETAKKLNPEAESLYHGKDEAFLITVGPYAFTFHQQTEFGKWFMDNGWGDSWGVLVYSSSDLKSIVKHFRQFLHIETEDGEDYFFRFYDPRVLRIFLPGCDPKQLKDFFGPVEFFVCEDEDPAFGIVFSLIDGLLHKNTIIKEQVVAFDPILKKKTSFFNIFSR